MANKKKILYLITQSELGGAGVYVLDLARMFKNEVDVIVAFGEQGEQGELVAKFKASNIEYYAVPRLKRSISPMDDLAAIKNIFKLIRKERPDIIHLNSSKISILGSFATFLARLTFIKTKVIYTAHGWVFNEPLQPGKKTFYRIAEKFTSKFKHKIICVSQFDYDTAVKEKIAPKKKLTMIHNGIEAPDFYSREIAKKKLEKLIPGLTNTSSFIVGTIGNLYKTKGFEYLIDAIKLLRDNGKSLALVIIGEGKERKHLEDWINQNKLEKDIFLAGRLDNASRYLKSFDIYTCSSVKEGLSYTILEAMLAELPIVATQVGGNTEMIREGETGLSCPAKKPEILANRILELFHSKESRQKLASAAHQFAKNEFSHTQMIDKTREAYDI